jgi:hypothetical protein
VAAPKREGTRKRIEVFKKIMFGRLESRNFFGSNQLTFIDK